jgi:hypothetical protein
MLSVGLKPIRGAGALISHHSSLKLSSLKLKTNLPMDKEEEL